MLWRSILPRVVLLPFAHCVSRVTQKSSKQYGSALLCLLAVATLPQPILCDASVPKPKQPEEIIYQQTEKQQCFSYGCPLIPQDVYYNVTVRHALQQLREDASSLSSALDSCGTDLSATLTLIGYKGGDPRHQVNQDRALVLSPYHISQNKNGTLLGVFDGHARLGEGVSQHVVDRLPTILKEKLNRVDTTQQEEEEEEEQTRVALIETFQQLDKTAPADISGGCTASVILQLDTKVYIANAGDSVSFLAVYHSNTNITSVIYKSREDKPTLPDERKRVERMGGQVYAPEQGTSRVLYTDPMTGYQSGLAMSRSIGDWEAGKVGVIPDPIVDVIDIPSIVKEHVDAEGTNIYVLRNDNLNVMEKEEQPNRDAQMTDDVYIFAVSATDGMIDFICAETIAATLGPALYGKDGRHVLTACEELISAAATGWQRAKQGRYRDDIAIAVSTIRIPPSALKQKEEMDPSKGTRQLNGEL